MELVLSNTDISLPPHKALQSEDVLLTEDQTWLTQEMVFTAVVGAQSISMQDSGAHDTQLTTFLLLFSSAAYLIDLSYCPCPHGEVPSGTPVLVGLSDKFRVPWLGKVNAKRTLPLDAADEQLIMILPIGWGREMLPQRIFVATIGNTPNIRAKISDMLHIPNQTMVASSSDKGAIAVL